jgi:hypothetical protein
VDIAERAMSILDKELRNVTTRFMSGYCARWRVPGGKGHDTDGVGRGSVCPCK